MRCYPGGSQSGARSYAEGRMRHILYGQEPSGVSLFGRPEHIRDVTAEQLTTLWQSFLACARLEVFYVGKASPETLEAHWRAAFAALQPACRTLPPTFASCCAACAAPRGRSAQSLTGAAVHGVVIGYHPVRKQATAASRHPVQ